MGCPVEYMDTLTPLEYGWLLESRLERDKLHYEMIAYAVTVGYARTQTKKKIEMFPKSSGVTGFIDETQKQDDLNYLNSRLGGISDGR